MNGLLEVFKRLGAARLAAMGVVALGLMGFFVYVIMRMSTPSMGLLFSDLTLEDSAQVVRELERRQVRYQLRNDGAQIMVQADQVARVRMQLAEGGLPRGGGVGYELFDRGDALSTTSFVQGINQLRAMEGELARTIRAIDRVQTARVHLVLPERPLFSRERVDPSASIVLRVRGGLEPQQIRAIRHLVASAVKGLSPQRVSIVDESGRLLADGSQDQAGMGGASVDERRIAHERRLRDQVETILASVVGPGRARVQVAADMDFNRITQTTDDFDPERRVVRSQQTREENANSTEGQRDGQVTVGNEVPGGQQNQQGTTSREATRKTEETINFEISRTQRTEVIEAGRIRRVSVAVLVDGVYGRDNAGAVTYQPRGQEELDRIGALVRSAIGFDQRRGDQVEVVNLRFAEAPQMPAAEAPRAWWQIYEPTRDDIRQAIELLVLLIVAILVLIFVVRPLIRRIVAPEVERVTAGGQGAPAGVGALAAGLGAAGALGASAANAAEGSPPLAPDLDNSTIRMLEQARIQGEVHAASMAKVGELVEQNPHETVAIIRQWLSE